VAFGVHGGVEMEINLNHILLGLIVILLFAVFVRLSSIAIQISRNQEINNAYNNDHHSQRGELLGNHSEHLDEISSNIQQLKSDIEDMKFVSDVFYKYKLPSKSERDFLDQVAIDNEVSDGIASARDKNT
jgi:Tfp pilus assembly protein PilN